MRREGPRSLAICVAAAIAAASPAGKVFACADLEAAPSTRWSLATEGGVSWLVTPCGERFFSLGVNVLDGGYPEREKAGKIYYSWTAFAPTLSDWTAETRRRLSAWGFNTAGGWALPPSVLKLPTIINLELGRLARFHWFDPFAPETETRMNALARELVGTLSRQPLPDRLFLRQRGRLVGRGAVYLLLVEAGELDHQAALGRAAPPSLCRRLAALCRRFPAAGRGGHLGPAPRRD